MSKSIFFNKKRRVPKFLQLYIVWFLLLIIFLAIASFTGVMKIKKFLPEKGIAPFQKEIPKSFLQKISKTKTHTGIFITKKDSKAQKVLAMDSSEKLALKILYHYGDKLRVFLYKDTPINNADFIFDTQTPPSLPIVHRNFKLSGLAEKEVYEKANISYAFSSIAKQVLQSAFLPVENDALVFGVKNLQEYQIKKLVHIALNTKKKADTSLWLSQHLLLKKWTAKVMLVFFLLLIWVPFLNQMILKQEKPDFISGIFSNFYLSLLPVVALILYKTFQGTPLLIAEISWLLVYFILFLQYGSKQFNVNASAISILFYMNVWLMFFSFVNQAYVFLFFFFPLLVSFLAKQKVFTRFLFIVAILSLYAYSLANSFPLAEITKSLSTTEEWLLAFFVGSLFSLVLGRKTRETY
ncbi:MAG: hypothetical protein D6767_10680 [Candidatus Hydrogenedentota bacterium]|nr:MAG: hypothetical protein D6767_10680 [Candidatus Hydrogenedentota bacterium]